MRTYYVTIRDMPSGNQRELRFEADDYGHAEEQAKPYIEDADEMIVRISLDVDYNILEV
jgi:hypothetical protein